MWLFAPKTSKVSVQSDGSRFVRQCRLIWSREAAKMITNTIRHYCSNPPFPALAYPLRKGGFSPPWRVVHVVNVTCFSKVVPPIVARVPVSVINLRRIGPGNKFPDNPRTQPLFPKQKHSSPARWICCSGVFQGIGRVKCFASAKCRKMMRRPNKPPQFSGLRIVRKTFFQECLRWHDASSHSVLLHRTLGQGQRAGSHRRAGPHSTMITV